MDSPDDDRPLLLHAIDIAWPIMEADIGTPDIMAVLVAPDTSAERVLAHAFLSVLDRQRAMTDPKSAPPLYRCGWCVRAAGDTDEAWQRTPSMDVAAMREHTLVCEHNQLVARVCELEVWIKAAMDDVGTDSLTRESFRAVLAKGITR